MSESPSPPAPGLHYATPATPAPGGRPVIVRTGGFLGLAACVIGLVALLLACGGVDSAFRFAPVCVGLGALGFFLAVVGGIVEKAKLGDDTTVLAALFACCMGIIGGLLEWAVYRGWPLLTHS